MEANDVMRQLQGFLGRVEVARPLVPEAPGALSVAALNAPKIQPLLAEAADFLDKVDRYYGRDRSNGADEDGSADAPSDLSDIGAMISVEIAGQEIADLAYLTLNNTKACAEELQMAIDRDEVLRIATLCDDGLRRLQRGLIAVQDGICQFEGWETPVRRQIDLASSLKVRRLFWEVRRIILCGDEPSEKDLPRYLRNIATVLDVIRSHNVYPLARIDDRVYIKNLVRRIESLLGIDGVIDDAEGRRMWQDAASFARLLSGINNRQEIREHDQEVVDYGCRVLSEIDELSENPSGKLPIRLLRQLETLVGLDSDLDRMIIAPHEVSNSEWQICLERLSTQLTGPSEDFGPDYMG